MSAKEVYIFGAGASHDSADTPLGKDLVWNYYLDTFIFSKVNPDGTSDLREENIEFKNLSSFFDLIEQEYPELKGEKKKWKEIRKQGYVYEPPYDLNKKYYVDEIIKQLKSSNKEGIEPIRRLVFEHIVEATLDRGNSSYETFVKGLAGKSPEDISIISMNFDCLLHKEFKGIKVDFDYLRSFDNNIAGINANSKKGGIPLIKLNGSLDWAFCPKCEKTTLISYHLQKNPYDGLSCKIDGGCGETLRPLVFLPHENQEDLLGILRNRAKSDLAQASKITVIGYSFPPYDTDIIHLINKHTSPDVLLEVIDKADDSAEGKRKKKVVEVRLKKIFPDKKNISISFCGFESYMRGEK